MEPDSETATVIQLIFQLAATGKHALSIHILPYDVGTGIPFVCQNPHNW